MTEQHLILASDYRGIDLRKALVKHCQTLGLKINDMGIEQGSSLDYVDITKQLVKEIESQPEALGILICGSGQGVSIYANRSHKIRAVLCRTPDDAQNARCKLNANVMCLGSKLISVDEAIACLQSFIETPFQAEKHQRSASKLNVSATAHTYSGVNLIVRAVIIHEGHVLLTTTTKNNTEFASDLYFLPGGHVDYKEPAAEALKREIKEEMEIDVKDLDYMGALECSWDRKGHIYHELNLVYKVDIANLCLKNPPVAVDPFHQFVWKPLSEISTYKILPEKLTPLILEATSSTKSLFLSQMLPVLPQAI